MFQIGSGPKIESDGLVLWGRVCETDPSYTDLSDLHVGDAINVAGAQAVRLLQAPVMGPSRAAIATFRVRRQPGRHAHRLLAQFVQVGQRTHRNEARAHRSAAGHMTAARDPDRSIRSDGTRPDETTTITTICDDDPRFPCPTCLRNERARMHPPCARAVHRVLCSALSPLFRTRERRAHGVRGGGPGRRERARWLRPGSRRARVQIDTTYTTPPRSCRRRRRRLRS